MRQVEVIRAGPELVEVVAELFDGYRQFYRQPPDRDGARRFLSERLTNRDSVIFLAVEGDGAAARGLGFTQLYPSFSSVRMRPLWVLNDLFVVPEARRDGVGRRLLDAAAELGRSTGACRIVLSTAKDNIVAKALYEATGYQLDQQFDHYELTLDEPGR
ncbi:MAG: GNAT family N-acetyltransferase [Gemmataceae bacterium]|nr:GNAT family N-acetyltransferase [Gemmataceae bacterium]